MTHEKYMKKILMKTVDFRNCKKCPKCNQPLMISMRYENGTLRHRCSQCGCFISEEVACEYRPRHIGKCAVHMEHDGYYLGKHEKHAYK